MFRTDPLNRGASAHGNQIHGSLCVHTPVCVSEETRDEEEKIGTKSMEDDIVDTGPRWRHGGYR